jgi:hypothetical protein
MMMIQKTLKCYENQYSLKHTPRKHIRFKGFFLGKNSSLF